MGWMGFGKMHVVSTEQCRLLLGEGLESLLDVGAGEGSVTDCMAPLFQNVVTTEASPSMAQRLRERGYRLVTSTIFGYE
jgi:16S rRNA A1518/A1519 N6-dimethyltransferase RsmA/KsgA/DIM1 with predicted DNA glycosylase/AP lyase activity